MSQDKQPLCQCGQPMTADDAEFWGECEKCRLKLPLQSAQLGDGSGRGAEHDRRYHGDQWESGEW